METAQSPSSPFDWMSELIRIPSNSKAPIKPIFRSTTLDSVLLFSSALASGIEALTTYPFSHTKFRVNVPPNPDKHLNIFSVFRYEHTMKLYRSCWTLVPGTASRVRVQSTPSCSFQAYLADKTKAPPHLRCIPTRSRASPIKSLVAGKPTERLSTILVSNIANTRAMCRRELHAFSAVLRTRSVCGLYCGLGVALLKQTSTRGVGMRSCSVIGEYLRWLDLPRSANFSSWLCAMMCWNMPEENQRR